MNDILDARELRANIRQMWLNQGTESLIQVKANIPGDHKNIAEAYIIVRFFEYQISTIFQIIKKERFESSDGPYTFISIKEVNPLEIKQKLISLEDSFPLGRLADLDLWTHPNHLWSRSHLKISPRICYLCDDLAHHCTRSEKHTLSEKMQFIKKTCLDHLMKEIKFLSKQALMRELSLENKFGLVTPTSMGSHHDMTFQLMEKAQQAIIPYFIEVFQLGYGDKELYQLFEIARPLGVEAENKMLQVTEGINCYKGVIFILGLVMLSLGYTIKHRQDFNHIFTNIHTLSQHLFEDFDHEPESFGEKAYHEHQISGARGEAYLGLPSVHHAIHSMTNKSLDDTTLRQLLQQLIRSTDDTVLLKRAKSFENYMEVKKRVASLDVTDIEKVKSFTERAIQEGLSFGGSADLLIATIFLYEIQKRYF